MIKWLKAFIAGVFIWYVLTIIYGTIVGMFELKNLQFFNSNSNLHNFILYPLGMWLGFKINKTSFWGTLIKKKETSKEKIFNKQMDDMNRDVEKEFSKIKTNKGISPIDNFLVPERHLSVLAWTVACWRLANENKTKKMMEEKKVAKFCRLFLAQEKKRKKIKDYNRADAYNLRLLSLACSLEDTDKLIIKNGWTYEVGKAFEKEIGYR